MINLLKILLSGKASLKFAVGVILGLAFSMAVILSTIGLMDGFEQTMRQGLRKSIGDFAIHSRDGFFSADDELINTLQDVGAESFAGVLQLEAFALSNGVGRGVLVRGVESESFTKVTSLQMPKLSNTLILGSVLSDLLSLKSGDDIVLSFAQGNNSSSALPTLQAFSVGGSVHHGIYQKDERFTYADLNFLQETLGLGKVVNSMLVKLDDKADQAQVESALESLRSSIGANYIIRPYWSEFRSLLQAVKAEKVMIGLVLQVIVVIAIINAAAFIIFLSESRSQELFLFKALGMSQNKLARGMKILVGLLWLISCLLAIVMEQFFSWLITHYGSSFLPGDIYYVASIEPLLVWSDYVMVALGALFWIAVILSFSLRQLRNSPILQGLRKEFS